MRLTTDERVQKREVEKFSELKGIAIDTLQNKTQKEKKRLKN